MLRFFAGAFFGISLETNDQEVMTLATIGFLSFFIGGLILEFGKRGQ